MSPSQYAGKGMTECGRAHRAGLADNVACEAISIDYDRTNLVFASTGMRQTAPGGVCRKPHNYMRRSMNEGKTHAIRASRIQRTSRPA